MKPAPHTCQRFWEASSGFNSVLFWPWYQLASPVVPLDQALWSVWLINKEILADIMAPSAAPMIYPRLCLWLYFGSAGLC